MANFHFVEDYERHVAKLIEALPIDEAMSVAVGGGFDQIGPIEARLMTWAGLKSGDTLVDFGCGSGRLAVAIAKIVEIEYIGFDIVQSLLDYAVTRCPPSYRFMLNRSLTLPLPDASADFVSSFSVFTHLLHSESYLYLEDMFRCLRPGGKVVASFLEFALPSHWPVFAHTVQDQRISTTPHLNQFIERNQFEAWAAAIGFETVDFLSGDTAAAPDVAPLGQSVAVLTKRS